MVTYVLKLQYCGEGFAGWALQPGQHTIEGEVTKALTTVMRQPVKLEVAGRTDAGVHARGQVVSFALGELVDDPGQIASRCNGVLPGSIRVLEAVRAPDGFSARRSAKGRTYSYRVWPGRTLSPFERGRALFWPRPIDSALLDRCALLLRGRHSFRSFTVTDAKVTRFERQVFDSEWRSELGGAVVSYWIEAESFLQHMVRRLVGAMLEVASGNMQLDDFERMLGSDRSIGTGYAAPAHGLYLESVRY